MRGERWFRRLSLAAIPLLGAALWLAREPAPAEPAPATSSDVTALGVDLYAPVAPASPGGGIERGAARTEAAPEPLPVAAAGLPEVKAPRHAHTQHPRMRAGRRKPRPVRYAAACGGVEARVISASDDPEWSFATLSPSALGSPVLARVGDRVAGRRVASIEWDRVWLDGPGGRCAAALNEAARAAQGVAGDPPRDSTEIALWALPDGLGERIEKRSETEFSLGKDALEALYAEGPRLLSGLRVEPERDASDVRGLRFDVVPEGSLLDRLGVQCGDVLTLLDGRRIDSPEAAIRALRELRGSVLAKATLERAGEALEIELRIGAPRAG